MRSTISGVSGLVADRLPLQVVDREERPPPVPRRDLRRMRRGVLVAVGLGTAAVVALKLVAPITGTAPRGPVPASDPPSPVVALGRLVPTGELRVLSAPYGAGDARVAEILVEEGQHVAAGSPLVRFDSAPVLEAAVQVAERQLSGRRAALAQAERAVAANQAEAAAALARAEVVATAADVEHQRWAALVERGFVSAAAADQRRTQRDEAAKELLRVRAAKARHEGDGARQPDLLVARRAVDAAEAERDRALRDVARSVLRAPDDGTVIAIRARPGERPGSAGVLDFGDTRVMTAELEVYQADVHALAAGQSVILRSPALTRPLQGRITSIGLSVGRQRLTDASPAASVDARVVRVRATLDEPSSALARRLVGLEVRAEVDTATR